MGTDLTIHQNGAAVETYDPFTQMDRWDEEALLAEMNGRVAKSLVYEFQEGGQTVVGLSKVGVDECCMVLVGQGQVIREEDIAYELVGEGEAEEALFKVKAARYSVSPDGHEVRLDQVIGVKREPKYRQTRRGKMYNPHWYETGAMKAARNARFRLIPAKVRESVIAAAKQAGQVRRNEPHRPQGGVAPEAWSDTERTKVVAMAQVVGMDGIGLKKFIQDQLGHYPPHTGSEVEKLVAALESIPGAAVGG